MHRDVIVIVMSHRHESSHLILTRNADWIRRFRHLQWELCKTQSYLDVLGDNPMTWTLALDTSPVPESSTQKPGRPPLFPY